MIDQCQRGRGDVIMSPVIALSQPTVDELIAAARVLQAWQRDGAPVQLHYGDLGWHWRFGAEATAAAVRTWSQDGRVLAIGLLDGPELLRVAIAPEAQSNEALARRVAADLTEPARGVLPRGSADVEARSAALLRGLLLDDGWEPGAPWTSLSRDLGEPVQHGGMRVATVDPRRVDDRVGVQRAAFVSSTFAAERWHVMATGPLYADARCLVAYDEDEIAVAVVSVWSAGPGRPGLIEPMGVHRDHRGRGYGRAITLAAAAALRDMGSSTAVVCTASANVGAVATYASAGLRRLGEVCDLRRRA